jgi:hypothetical protein
VSHPPKRRDPAVVDRDVNRRELRHTYPQLADLAIQLIPHGPYAHHAQFTDADRPRQDGNPSQHLPTPGEVADRLFRTPTSVIE